MMRNSLATFSLLLMAFLFCSIASASVQPQPQGRLDAALARATEAGDVAKVVDRLQRGARVDALTPLGQTPLELAAEYGRLAAAQVLLSHSANANLASSFGTPLIWACERGDVALARLLLDHGADVGRKNNTGSPLAVTIAGIGVSRVQASNPVGLRVSIAPDTRENRWLAEQLARKTAEQINLLSAGTTLGARERRQAHGLEIVRLLLAHGADVNHRDESGETPLLTAAQVGSVPAAQILLENGARADLADETSLTALMHAAMMDHGDVLQFLVLHGANVNAQSRDGWTALFWAVTNSNTETITFLLDHGADARLKAKDGLTVLKLAKQRANQTTVSLLEQAGATE